VYRLPPISRWTPPSGVSDRPIRNDRPTAYCLLRTLSTRRAASGPILPISEFVSWAVWPGNINDASWRCLSSTKAGLARRGCGAGCPSDGRAKPSALMGSCGSVHIMSIARTGLKRDTYPSSSESEVVQNRQPGYQWTNPSDQVHAPGDT
jgi:hypothetical protein